MNYRFKTRSSGPCLSVLVTGVSRGTWGEHCNQVHGSGLLSPQKDNNGLTVTTTETEHLVCPADLILVLMVANTTIMLALTALGRSFGWRLAYIICFSNNRMRLVSLVFQLWLVSHFLKWENQVQIDFPKAVRWFHDTVRIWTGSVHLFLLSSLFPHIYWALLHGCTVWEPRDSLTNEAKARPLCSLRFSDKRGK